MEDEHGELLGARIAEDGQWRFPASDSLPVKFMEAAVAFEDQRFWQHPGVDPLALGRAFRQNWEAGRIVSGGSTISMQVIRLAKHNPPRTIWQKFVELLQALRLDFTYSKEEILQLWSAHAPFGGNVVGLDAATWRYFGKASKYLSWAEAATLAVLPNSPGLIHPGRNRDQLRAKRDRLLDRLVEQGIMEATSGSLAKQEALPEEPLPLPRLAPHLLDRLWKEHRAGRYTVTLDRQLQERLNTMVRHQYQRLHGNGIHNIALLVVEVESGKTLAYVGNVPQLEQRFDPDVDLITAARSPGSLLKPLLYASALQDARLLPGSLLPDIPSVFQGFRPENFHEDYSGVIRANEALARSLNIPFVYLLQRQGVPIFHQDLNDWGFQFIQQAPSHYGLSLILGGCEISLWQAVSWYASMGRMLRHYYPQQGQYSAADWREAHFLLDEGVPTNMDLSRHPPRLGAGSAWFTLEAMQTLQRPDSEGEWEYFRSSRRLAWKTGTSYGFRDAWAIGIDPTYAIGVWVGNADGEGRPGLVGVEAAAPILFAAANSLPSSNPSWFEQPYDDCRRVSVCAESGYLPLPHCPIDSVWIPKTGLSAPPCPYHEQIHVDASGRWRVDLACVPSDSLHTIAQLALPPLEAHYYQRRNPQYMSLPPWRSDCGSKNIAEKSMELIYPRHPSQILVPVGLDGSLSATVFSVAHQQTGAEIHWHLDQDYLGATTGEHQMELRPAPGEHQLVLVDQDGNRLVQAFTILARHD